MTKEVVHFRQSDKLDFLNEDYLPYQKNKEGEVTYGVIAFVDENWIVRYAKKKPSYGGYIARESIYGSPDYCPTATRQHKIHLAEYGSTPHLVFFENAESAEMAGFRRCKKCI